MCILQFPNQLLSLSIEIFSLREEIISLTGKIIVFAIKTTSFEHDSQQFMNLNFRIFDLYQKLKNDIFGQLWKLWFQSHSKAISPPSEKISPSRKKAIDLETVVDKKALKSDGVHYCYICVCIGADIHHILWPVEGLNVNTISSMT